MDETELAQLKLALNGAACWLMSVCAREVPLSTKARRGRLLALLTTNESGQLFAGDLAAFFAGLATQRTLISLTGDDIQDIDVALVELSWFLPLHIMRSLSCSLHPRPRLLLNHERIAC